MESFYRFLAKTLTIIVVFIFAQVANAGTRYKDIVFTSVNATMNVPFGSNVNIDGSNDSLFLDFYTPAGDTLTSRPLVICIHGGSLVSGDRSEMGSFCTDFAKRGYVAATIDYRLGIESPKGVTTILEALLRGVQDAKAAVRFFRSKAAEYGIDTSRIYLEGSSAGSMVAVHDAYWNEDEIPPDVNQTKWGDVDGASGNPGYSTAIKGIINYCGGIVNPTWINAGEVPVASIDGLDDTIIPQDSGTSGDFGIELYGGIAIGRIATRLGVYNQGVYFPGQGHGGGVDSLPGFSSNFLYSLMVLSSSQPHDFTSMVLSAKSLKVFRYDSYTFTTSALDPSGNRIILPSSWIQYSCDSRIGSIQPWGVFTPGDHSDSGYVYAKFNNTTDSCFVKTYGIQYILLKPKFAVTDTLRALQLSVDTYDADSVLHNLPITMFTLTSTNPSVGTVDSTGVFAGKMNGTTDIIASLNNYSDTSTIRVESASGVVSLDALDSLGGWTFTGANLDSLSVTLATDQKSTGNASFKIQYKFTYDPSKSTYMIYLSKDVLVYGIPDSIYLDVKSDGRNHRLYYRLSDADSNLFRAIGRKYLNDSVAFDNINASMTSLSPLTGSTKIAYPLTFKRIEIQLAGDQVQGVSTSGTIYVDNLRLKYPGNVTGVMAPLLLPGKFRLEQNYPNPFNPSTHFRFTIADFRFVTLKVYDLLGREVATLVSERKSPGTYEMNFDGSRFSSGIYFYRLTAGSFVDTKKFVLLK
ncbi:MAG: carboxylesterase family protein [Bacteroidota bacterium]|nr:carboxylesterase family protein [Bacteroidota bacterium]